MNLVEIIFQIESKSQTVANRIIEISPNGMLDKVMTYDEYLESDKIAGQREELQEV